MEATSSAQTSATQLTAVRIYQFCLKHVLLRQTFRGLRARNVYHVFMTTVQPYAVLNEIHMYCDFYYNFPTPIRMEIFFDGSGVNAFGAGSKAGRKIMTLLAMAKPLGAIH
jgi:hypothetical protein